MFPILDDDNTGGITLKNLKRLIAETGETLTDAELQEIVKEADSSGKGQSINEDDFLRLMGKKEPAPGTSEWLEELSEEDDDY